MNEELLRQALQTGQITPAQFEEFMRNMQGLLGGQQMAPMPQAPEPTMPMMPMPSADPSQMQMSPMPMVGNGGQDTPAERDYLEQFVENYNKNGVMSRGVDTPQERDFLQNIMQDYNKRY